MINNMRLDTKTRSLQQLRRDRVKAHPRRLRRPPRMLHPQSQTREYQRALKAIIGKLEAIVNHIYMNQLPHLVAQARALRPEVHQDAYSDQLNDLISSLRIAFQREFSEDEVYDVALKAGIAVSDFNKTNIVEIFKSVLEINPILHQPYLEPTLKAFASINTTLIESIPTKFFTELEEITYRGLIKGTLYSDIADEIQDRFGVAESRANLIARDQVSKLNSQLNELRQTELGVTSYIWRTSLDERVRESHEEKEGNEYRWDDPPSDTGNPGDDINCRCYGEPVMEEVSDSPTTEESDSTGE